MQLPRATRLVVRIAGKHMYLWRAVDHEGEVLEILVQRRRDRSAAVKLMRKVAPQTRLRADEGDDREAALLRRCLPASRTFPRGLEPERCGSPFLFDRVKKLAFRR